ncbi:IS110 family transposase [Muribaculaceae bacterium Isolate-007 (NCI)]|uniref:IS110 family transposase n=16 Tax=Muribaculaceae TaxID=2005473 RepID=UPI000F47D24E|nr:IS110 family transposase [Muribaculum intestinale]ROT01445.1 IS110 family transposase [Muribaculaceae bacterium Isolate-100 (HZI)]RXE63561.1 IS110 family transposase [Muribaculaceae bacterium Isolate-007 (NCI)]
MDRNRTVAGLDIHKDSIYLCIMRHDETIIFENKYGVLTPDLRQMCNDMVERGVTEAAMESTAVYWVPVWNELCESMKLKLVNPYFIKQLPGRKSDVKDAQWIAECLLKNLIKGSFVPEPIVQDMRKLNRRIMDLNEDMTYNCNKLDAAMQRCGFRLSNYVNTIKSRSYQKVLVAIIGGTARPDELVKMVHGRTINKHGRDTIKAAVTGTFSETDITIFRQIKEVIDMIERQIEECQKELTALCEQHFPEQFRRLQTIPGVKERAATAIIAETGVDMKMFATAACLVGWCGLKPRNDVSNGRYKSRKVTHGNRYLRQILIEIAWGASRTRNCFFSYFSYIQTTVKKKSKMKIQVAIARKILVAIWHMLSKEQDFIDIYLKRLEENRKMEEQLKSLESKMA